MGDVATASTIELKITTFEREDCYSPGLYRLDLSTAIDLPVKMNGEPSTFEDVYAKLVESKVREGPDRLSFGVEKYVTEAGDIKVEAEWTILSQIQMLIGLVRQDIDPYSVMWFYYSTDWSWDGDVCHLFFAVYGDKIVLESCNFSSEEPLILKLDKKGHPLWLSHPHFDEALVHYWYKRFYTESLTGKLMVLRPDEPLLYYYERQSTRDTVEEVAFVTLVKTYRLLWVVAALLAAIAFPPIKEIMGIVAAVLLIDVLWRAWATRKVGD